MALPYNPLTKPQKLTPEEKRRRKAEVRAIKAEFHPELYQAPMKVDPDEHDRYRVTGSALHSVSREKLKRNKGKILRSTFTPKPGKRLLNFKRSIQAHIIRSVRTTGYTLKRGKALNLEGVRGRRMKPGDRKQEVASHALCCVCGCNAHLQPGAGGIPGKGLIARAHLDSRRYESTRNEDWNNLPACLFLNEWLDRIEQGIKAKDELFELAQAKQKRLSFEEVQPVITEHGYYTWVDHERRIL